MSKYFAAPEAGFHIKRRANGSFTLYAGNKYVSDLSYFEEMWFAHDLELDRLLAVPSSNYPEGLFLSARDAGRFSAGPFSKVRIQPHLAFGAVVTLTALVADERPIRPSPVAPFLIGVADQFVDDEVKFVDGPHLIDGITHLTIGLPCSGEPFGVQLEALSTSVRGAVRHLYAAALRYCARPATSDMIH